MTSPVRILLVHNYYRQPGGEDVVVANEQALLERHGHEARLWSVGNDEIEGFWVKAKTALNVTYSSGARDRLAGEIRDFAPDLVHVHNFFPLLTPSIYDACRDAGVPVVQTLHNYRTVCAGETLMRDGRPCEDCLAGSPYQAVLHRCFRGSRLGSLAVARMVDFHGRKRTWHSKVDRFIALTAFARSRFLQAGFPPEKIAVKPNFIEDPLQGDLDEGARGGALFVGRLSPEKGIATLMTAWSELKVPLKLVGDGPMMGDVTASGHPGVTPLGWRPRAEVSAEMRRAAFMVMPSIWYEGFPMTIVEAFGHGLPIVASRLGAMAEIVEDGKTGLHFNPGDPNDLAEKVRWASDHPEEMRRMGERARQAYEENYAPQKNYEALLAIYQEALLTTCQ